MRQRNNFTRAYHLSDNVSEREKLYIAGHYYSGVVGDLNKAIETLQVATQEYPLQVDNFINLGVLYLLNGELRRANGHPQGPRMQPDNAIALENGIAGSVQPESSSRSEKYIAEAQRLGLNGTSLLSIEAGFYASQSDWNGVQRILAETAGRPDQFAVTRIWANILPQLGQIQLARTTFLRAADQAASAKDQDAQAGALLSAASAGWMVDRCFDPEPSRQRGPEIG